MAEKIEDLPLFSSSPGMSPSTGEDAIKLQPDSSLNAAIHAWEEALSAAGRSIHTVKAFTGDLRLFAKYVGSGQSLNSIGTHDIRNFLEWMLNRRDVPCSPKTYARRITSIKAFFRWLAGIGVLTSDPSAAVPQQTVLSPLPEVLTLEEVAAVHEAADAFRYGSRPDARQYTLVRLLLHTAIKKNECLSIHLNHIELNAVDGPILFIRYSDIRKRYRERKLSLPADWVEAYRSYLAQYHPRDKLFPYSPRRLEYLLEDIGTAAGLEKHLSFNMCRWSSALLDYKAGDDKNQIRQKLGISKIQWREVGAKLDRLAARNTGIL